MKGIYTILLVCLTPLAMAQKADVVKLPYLKQIIESKSNKVQVVNFWATWCGPCVKELPLFEKLNSENRPDVAVTLVSLDLDLDPNPEKVYRFIAKKNIKSDVLLLDERNPNEWIDQVEKEWSGSLPATLVVNTNTGKRIFVARELKEGELEEMISKVK